MIKSGKKTRTLDIKYLLDVIKQAAKFQEMKKFKKRLLSLHKINKIPVCTKRFIYPLDQYGSNDSTLPRENTKNITTSKKDFVLGIFF